MNLYWELPRNSHGNGVRTRAEAAGELLWLMGHTYSYAMARVDDIAAADAYVAWFTRRNGATWLGTDAEARRAIDHTEEFAQWITETI